MAPEPLADIFFLCSFQLRELSISTPSYFVCWITSSSLLRIFKCNSSLRLWRMLCFCFVDTGLEFVFATFRESLLPLSQVPVL